jgi:hypothetical protein
LKLESGGAKNINKRMDVGIDECDWCLFDLNALTKNLKLETDDRMLTNSPARLEPILRMSLHHQIAVGLVLPMEV